MSEVLSDRVSERIALVRVLCIAGMIYVHVPTPDGPTALLAFDPGDGFATLRAFLVEGFGRASAGLLSVVSGYLTARALLAARASPGKLYRRRFRSIVLPMVVWGSATLCLYALVSLYRPTFLTVGSPTLAEMLYEAVNAVLFVTEMPVGPTMHLGFLRDLFVCMLLAPLLLSLLDRSAILVLAALLLVYLLDVETVIVMRPLILLCFTIGLWLFVSKADVTVADRYWLLWLVIGAAITLAIMAVNAGVFQVLAADFARRGLDLKETLLYPLCRLFGSLSVWTLSAHAVASPSWYRLSALTPYVFVAYCSHYVVLTLAWHGLWLPLAGGDTGFFFTLWFLAAPAISIVVAWMLVRTLTRWMPGVADLLTGGRRRSARPATRAI